MRLQHGVAVLIAITFLILGVTVLAPSGAARLWSLYQKKKSLETKVAVLQKRIFEQKEKIRFLSGGTPRSRAYLEQIARREYGFVGKQESLLVLH